MPTDDGPSTLDRFAPFTAHPRRSTRTSVAARASECNRQLQGSAGQHRLADDLGAVHQAAQAFVEGVAAMHDAAVVPHHEIADPPLLIPGEALLRGVGPHRVEKLLALLDAQPVDVGAGPAAEEQRLAPG